jgi:ABC-type antimicrobial peptide transport system permease subunit
VIISKFREEVESVNSNFSVFELDEILDKIIAFQESAWSAMRLLPFLALATTTLCLAGFMVLTFDVQRHEFAVLRAVGINPKAIFGILIIQSILVLISSFAVGISLGVIATLLILVPDPVVTSFTIVEVTSFLLASLLGMFLLSLFQAKSLAKTPILKMIV